MQCLYDPIVPAIMSGPAVSKLTRIPQMGESTPPMLIAAGIGAGRGISDLEYSTFECSRIRDGSVQAAAPLIGLSMLGNLKRALGDVDRIVHGQACSVW